MRASGIRVFDGLRIATEHVEHLQDSLQSSIEDLREAAGVGRVISGFGVQADGDDAIVVEPGLAFDRRRRRLALDEPRRVDAGLPPGREVQYVCVEHERVEDGEVEGRATLLWDGLRIILRDSAPDPAADDHVALAKLVRPADPTAPGFSVAALEREPAAAPAVVAAGPRIRQGVVRLPALDVPKVDAVVALRKEIDKRLANAGGELTARVPLATAEAAAGGTVAAVSCVVRLDAHVASGDGTATRIEAAAHGEATFTPEGMVRFGLSTVRTADGTWTGSDWTEDAVTTLPLAPALADPAAPDLLPGLRLLVDVAPAAPAGVAVSCALEWSGSLDERRLAALREGLAGVAWSAVVGWKAVGA